jgi:hypothetical protein
MAYDYREKKMVAVLSAALEPGTALNVLGHLCVALGVRQGAGLRERHSYADASGIQHESIAKYPLIVTKVKPARLRQLIVDARAQGPALCIVDYPRQMLETGHDDELAQAIAVAREESIEYLGVLLFGSSPLISQLTGRFTLY